MDIEPTTQQQPISDDQELAKALAGVTPQTEAGLQFEDTPSTPSTSSGGGSSDNSAAGTDMPAPTAESTDSGMPPTASTEPTNNPEPIMPSTAPSPTPEPAFNPMPTPATAGDGGNLESIKKDALVELRPLVDKLNISPEEKFDTYLLLIRSTDDTSLVAPAHAAAAAITDETRRAQALLDIIKEIDYLSNPQQGNQLSQ